MAKKRSKRVARRKSKSVPVRRPVKSIAAKKNLGVRPRKVNLIFGYFVTFLILSLIFFVFSKLIIDIEWEKVITMFSIISLLISVAFLIVWLAMLIFRWLKR